jgi:phospholipid/cholesterol/gamma-HCH transport system permease protein
VPSASVGDTIDHPRSCFYEDVRRACFFRVIGGLGRISLFLGKAVVAGFRRPLELGQTLLQMHFVGAESVGVILLTSAFTGMVLVLQGYHALTRFGGEAYIGPLVALSLMRELGPVLAAIMVTARAGSAIAASLGTMRISEQIDALVSMSVDPMAYLVVPRLLAAVVVMPILTAVFDLSGIAAAYGFGVAVLKIDGGAFLSSIRDSVTTSDLTVGLWKAEVFAVVIPLVSAYQGFETTRGALGVGISTTKAVVAGVTTVIATDYVMTALLF